MFTAFDDDPVIEVPEKDYWMCSPVVFGFDFGTKTWACFDVNNLSEIEFSKNAFNELIIPEEYRTLFMSCLESTIPSFDVIEGKGAGKIFLLYGGPGSGKTLSAESIAEYMKVPLYFVSIGELGTSASQMEDALNDIINIASTWNAIVLLDEVDVFAMKRTGQSLEKNAMTAIMLRTLERFTGVMFMTTNLVEDLDPAFCSRAVRLKYDELGDDTRLIIWNNLIKKSKSFGIKVHKSVKADIPEFAAIKINGREIKTALRIACSIAQTQNKNVLTSDLIRKTINLSYQNVG
jgi:AAA+ superfamily predicted ATPase